jgi:two-component system, LuxR family, response regulator FixJ
MIADADVHVIDDDEAVRESIDFLLRTAGLSVRTYDSATSFLDAAPKIGAGCVITDVRMPGLTGIDLLRRLQESKSVSRSSSSPGTATFRSRSRR